MDHEFLITMRLSFSLALITTLILLPIGIFLGYFLSLKRNFLKPPKQKSQISLVFGMNALVPLGTI
ncbi:hypothetical protein HpBGD104_12480 [Helicobacter pylori]|uniref:hypothetical protein n=1 Tax=Helicobacter pylori TaxID=210 RepID=UPI0036F41555